MAYICQTKILFEQDHPFFHSSDLKKILKQPAQSDQTSASKWPSPQFSHQLEGELGYPELRCIANILPPTHPGARKCPQRCQF